MVATSTQKKKRIKNSFESDAFFCSYVFYLGESESSLVKLVGERTSFSLICCIFIFWIFPRCFLDGPLPWRLVNQPDVAFRTSPRREKPNQHPTNEQKRTPWFAIRLACCWPSPSCASPSVHQPPPQTIRSVFIFFFISS